MSQPKKTIGWNFYFESNKEYFIEDIISKYVTQVCLIKRVDCITSLICFDDYNDIFNYLKKTIDYEINIFESDQKIVIEEDNIFCEESSLLDNYRIFNLNPEQRNDFLVKFLEMMKTK